MLRLYRAGLMSAQAPTGVESMLREELLLSSIGQELDAELARAHITVGAHFACAYKEPAKARDHLISRLRTVFAYGEGDSTALLRSKNQQTSLQALSGLTDMWRQLHQQGMV